MLSIFPREEHAKSAKSDKVGGRPIAAKFRQSIDINDKGILPKFKFDRFSIDDVMGK